MVERHPFLDLISHALLALGVMVIVFPIYLALVGSTHSAQDMAQSPIPIWFGQDAWLNYRTILL
jgi:sn-glycerol 3-phosphate transport system permease protein